MEYTEEEKKAVERMTKVRDKKLYTFTEELTIVLNLIEKKQKEIEEKDKQIDRLSLVRQEVSYGYDNTYLITNEKLAIIERNTYKIEVEEGIFVDIRKLYDDYKDSIPKEAIREKIKQLIQKLNEPNNDRYEKDDNLYYDKIKCQIRICKELLGDD